MVVQTVVLPNIQAAVSSSEVLWAMAAAEGNVGAGRILGASISLLSTNVIAVIASCQSRHASRKRLRNGLQVCPELGILQRLLHICSFYHLQEAKERLILDALLANFNFNFRCDFQPEAMFSSGFHTSS